MAGPKQLFWVLKNETTTSIISINWLWKFLAIRQQDSRMILINEYHVHSYLLLLSIYIPQIPSILCSIYSPCVSLTSALLVLLQNLEGNIWVNILKSYSWFGLDLVTCESVAMMLTKLFHCFTDYLDLVFLTSFLNDLCAFLKCSITKILFIQNIVIPSLHKSVFHMLFWCFCHYFSIQ